ncbi:presqualene diphosphate synthase HpnD [Endothiovibrio diazotrophicus]
MTPDEYCEDRARRSGSSFYQSFRFLPPERRRALTALYAFCREVDDVVDECSEPALARIKLAWWREEVGRIYGGQAQHPVGLALSGPVERFGLDRDLLIEIIDGMEMDLDHASYPTFRELALYCHRVAGVVGLLAAEIFGYEDRATRKYAEALGLAFQLTNILRDVREDAERGRLYLPLDELARFGHTPGQLLSARDSTPFIELFRFQAARAREQYDKAFELLPEGDRLSQLPGLIMAEIYRTNLEEIEHDGLRVLDHRISIPKPRKVWLALRCAWREKRRHRRWLKTKS